MRTFRSLLFRYEEKVREVFDNPSEAFKQAKKYAQSHYPEKSMEALQCHFYRKILNIEL
jgi:hypothetical protein